MAYLRQGDPFPQGGHPHPSTFESPTYALSPSPRYNSVQNYPGILWQNAAHERQQESFNLPLFASRRSSYATQYGSGGVPSSNPSMSPSMSWATTSQNRQFSSPPIDNSSPQSHANYSGSQCSALTTVKHATSMNATAPPFTPRLAGTNADEAMRNKHPGIYPDSRRPTSFFSVVKPTSMPRLHRTAPSISLSTLNRPIATPARSPLFTRGVSPAASNFSTGNGSTPLHDSFGLRLSKPRTYKVSLPSEDYELAPEDTRKISLWSRRPLYSELDMSPGINDPDCIAEDVRSKSPYPAEVDAFEELPETLEVYLPNDWVTLRQALVEDRMAKLGITTDYLQRMDAQLADKALSVFFSNSVSLKHLRSESVFAIPFVPGWVANTLVENQKTHSPVGPFATSRHRTAVSMAAPLGTQVYMEQQPPYGLREVIPSRAAGANFFGASDVVEDVEEEAEEEIEELLDSDQYRELGASNALCQRRGVGGRPASTFILQEQGSGACEHDASSQLTMSVAVALKNSTDRAKATPPALTCGRIAIEGAVGYSSLPTSASMGDVQDYNDSLNAVREARKSVSAPDLHKSRLESAQKDASNGHQSGSGRSERDGGYTSSGGCSEYSNPSDEERARLRRDKGLRSRSLSPAARLHNLDSWLEPARTPDLDHHVQADTLKRQTWSVEAEGSEPKVLTATFDATALPIELEANPMLRCTASSLFSSASCLQGTPAPFTGQAMRPSPTKSSFVASESSFAFAQKASLNVAAAEFKPRQSASLRLDHDLQLASLTSLTSEQDSLMKNTTGKDTVLEAEVTPKLWLPDSNISGDHVTESPAKLPCGAETENIEDTARDKVRTFKFPAAPPAQPACDSSRIIPGAAQGARAPLEPIGTNTLGSDLGNFEPRQYLEEGSSHPFFYNGAPSHRQASIPDFGTLSGGSECAISQTAPSATPHSSHAALSIGAINATPPPADGSERAQSAAKSESNGQPRSALHEIASNLKQDASREPTSPSWAPFNLGAGCSTEARHTNDEQATLSMDTTVQPGTGLSSAQPTTALDRQDHHQSLDLFTDIPSVTCDQSQLMRATPEAQSSHADVVCAPNIDTENTLAKLSSAISQAVRIGLSEAVPDLLQALMPSYSQTPASAQLTTPRLHDEQSYIRLRQEGTQQLVQRDSQSDRTHIPAAKGLVSALTDGCNVLQDERDDLLYLEPLRQKHYLEILAKVSAVIEVDDDKFQSLREELLPTMWEMCSKGEPREGVRKDLDTTGPKVSKHDTQCVAYTACHEELQEALKAEVAAYAQREQEHIAQIRTMQGILSNEAASRVHLEDHISTLQAENTTLSEELRALQHRFSAIQISNAALEERMTAAQDAMTQVQQISTQEAHRSLQESVQRQHERVSYIQFAEQAQRSLLVYMLSHDQTLDVPGPIDGWKFETCIGPIDDKQSSGDCVATMQDTWVVAVTGV